VIVCGAQYDLACCDAFVRNQRFHFELQQLIDLA
jgi:hypothetical protein